MGYTRRQYAIDTLKSAGITNYSPEEVDWMIAWGVAETAPGEAPNGGAQFNLYNTTQQEPGSTWFNTFGSQGQYHVMNYPNYQEGVTTNAKELNNGNYPALVQALQNNDLNALGYNSGVPSGAIQSELGTWGTGAAWVRNVGSFSSQYGDQQFSGVATTIPGGSAPPSPRGPCPWANVPVLGGIYCAGWNVGGALGIPTSPCAPWDVPCIAQAAAPYALRVGLAIGGLILVVIGLHILFPAITGPGAGAIDKLVDTIKTPETGSSPAPAQTDKAKTAASVAAFL